MGIFSTSEQPMNRKERREALLHHRQERLEGREPYTFRDKAVVVYGTTMRTTP